MIEQYPGQSAGSCAARGQQVRARANSASRDSLRDQAGDVDTRRLAAVTVSIAAAAAAAGIREAQAWPVLGRGPRRSGTTTAG
jgi:hypothetical protein